MSTSGLRRSTTCTRRVHTCVGCSVDERPVIVDPLRGLGARDLEQGLDSLQCCPRRRPVGVGRLCHLGARQVRRTRRVPEEQPLLGAGLREEPSYPASEASTGPGHCNRRHASATALSAAMFPRCRESVLLRFVRSRAARAGVPVGDDQALDDEFHVNAAHRPTGSQPHVVDVPSHPPASRGDRRAEEVGDPVGNGASLGHMCRSRDAADDVLVDRALKAVDARSSGRTNR